ncbi:MAG: rRNA pseudouridine synthase [Clostridia bacterium]|nr:rRNA pseudouridine synthase [Clostridia bacterium]
MERIDKIISSQGKYTRSEIKKLAAKGQILVDGKIIQKTDIKVDKNQVKITINAEELNIKEHLYLILNKPKGYVSATEDRKDKTVLDLVPEELYRDSLFPAGRLDKDTTGLMIITDDGELAHNILAPKKHIKKIYEVTLDIPVTEKMIEKFAEGIKLNDGECKSAILEITGENTCKVTITEGRYHQIKRMFGCCKAKVIELNRICMGNLFLPTDLTLGECRELTTKELELLQKR